MSRVKAMPSNDLDIQIEEYLEGRMDAPRRAQFEARMQKDPDLRRQVETTTNSIKMVREALVKVDPAGDFEEKVSSQIVSITQSNPNLRAVKGSGSGKLSAQDPDAKLILDPEAEMERKRLVVLAIIAGIFFAAAIAVIIRAVVMG